MDELFVCVRIMQISTDKLQSIRTSESLRRSSLIRSTYVQSRKHFYDLIHSLIKISSTTNTFVPVIRETRMNNHSLKRKSCHIDAIKRIRLTSPSSPSSSSSSSTTSASTNVSNEIGSD